MNHQDILRTAAATVTERGKGYGDVEFMFDLVAQLATLVTGREFTPADVTVIHECTKLARRRVNPDNPDHYIDQINYTAFSAQLARLNAVPSAAHEPVSVDQQLGDKVEADIIKLAKKFAPLKEAEPEKMEASK